MLFDFGKKPHVSVYGLRRKSLIQSIKDKFGADSFDSGNFGVSKGVDNKEVRSNGAGDAVLLIGGFHKESASFVQDSSFYYFTGIELPGVALLINEAGKATLYIPRYADNDSDNRNQSLDRNGRLDTSKESATRLGIDAIAFLGDRIEESSVGQFTDLSAYKNLIEQLKMASNSIYTFAPTDFHSCVEQRLFLMRLLGTFPAFSSAFVDITPLAADLRSSKDMGEIELIKGAVSVATIAHEAAAHIVADQIPELDIQAGLEGVVTMAGARIAFPTNIVSGAAGLGKSDLATGQAAEYIQNGGTLSNGQLVTIDIGVMYNNYIANLARTYPISGAFNKHQRTLYDVLVAAQEYIIDFIQSGNWIFNAEVPNKSLFHLLKIFFTRYNYEHYFVQDIGYHTGLDLRDLADNSRPLQTGDVIVLALGLYIPKDSINILIKDIYWVIKKGAINLSEELPIQAEDVELFMKERPQQDGEDEEDLFDDYQDSDDLDSFDFSNQDDIEH